MPKNLKKRSFRLIQRFLQTENQKNARGYPLINFENFRKKSHSAEKTQRGPFGLTCTFGSIKKFMVQCENRTHALWLGRR